MKDFQFFLETYMREYRAQEDLGISSSSIHRNYLFTDDVLDRTFRAERTPSEKQLSVLVKSCDQFDTYARTSSELGSEFRHKLSLLYQDLGALLDGFKNSNGDLTTNKSSKTLAIKFLQEKRLIFPHFLYRANGILKELESRGLDVDIMKARYNELSDLYWQVFGRKKTEKSALIGKNAA